ncbi:hypothetical protein E2C01_039198 [Portunus trituberculatus]|uniref:Uncharacterized protein n=1 Tax=Portunus trituberculatus TaxID=210409 RepID=A0A5B7FK05_PORTR|nr:hypothetical protein [Portunus trituberculatus]
MNVGMSVCVEEEEEGMRKSCYDEVKGEKAKGEVKGEICGTTGENGLGEIESFHPDRLPTQR